jgi:hypothetical protein
MYGFVFPIDGGSQWIYSIIPRMAFYHLFLIPFNDIKKQQTHTKMHEGERDIGTKNVTIKTIKFTKMKTSFFHKLFFYYYFYISAYILSSNAMQRFPMKLKTQTHICINYYNPFKLDLIHKPKYNNIDYVIMSSNISCQIDSIASHIPCERYRAFGLPKEDLVINPRYSKEEIMNKLKLDDGIKKIILYTPTHRDYEKNSNIKRNALGYDGDYEKLNMILKRNDAMLIIEMHGGTS